MYTRGVRPDVRTSIDWSVGRCAARNAVRASVGVYACTDVRSVVKRTNGLYRPLPSVACTVRTYHPSVRPSVQATYVRTKTSVVRPIVRRRNVRYVPARRPAYVCIDRSMCADGRTGRASDSVAMQRMLRLPRTAAGPVRLGCRSGRRGRTDGHTSTSMQTESIGMIGTQKLGTF